MDQKAMEQLCRRLPERICAALYALAPLERENLEEIRAYEGREIEFVLGGKVRKIPVPADMEELLCALSAQALYSCERQMARGYISLPGGHRAGVCGRMVCEAGGIWRLAQVSSVCIRIGRHVKEASLPIRPYMIDERGSLQRVLVLGAPGCGKTTVLRDAALWLAENGIRVAAADEREELFAAQERQSAGKLDVLGGMDKADALPMLIRTMAPQMLVTDEIGKTEDVHAVLDAMRCGVGLLASAHADSIEGAMRRPVIRELFAAAAFDWYVLLGRRARVLAVCNQAGETEGRKEWSAGMPQLWR